MSVLHVNRMEFIAEDYLARCAPELAELMTGKLYTAQVARLLESIRAQRASTAANGGGAAPDKALVQEQMDLQNDLMNTIWATITGLATDRKQKPQVRAALAEVSAHVLPKRPSARMSAIRRVDAAQSLAPLVEAHAKSLAAIPCLGGGTVLERAREYLACAETLATLISQETVSGARGPTAAGAGIGSPVTLAAEGMRIFKSMRATLTAEMAHNPALPRDLVTRTFALYDRSVAEARPARRATKAAPDAAEARGAAA